MKWGRDQLGDPVCVLSVREGVVDRIELVSQAPRHLHERLSVRLLLIGAPRIAQDGRKRPARDTDVRYLESPSALRSLRVVPIDLLYALRRATRLT